MPHRPGFLPATRRALFPFSLGSLSLAAGWLLAGPASAAVMISQVYGGGGNSGAPYTNDFVELHNSGASAVSVAGWSIQYASSSGSTWGGSQLTPLSGSIPAGGYYLVQLGAGTASPAPLPTPDATGSTAMSATAGKVALVNHAAALSGACPIPAVGVVDFVGYGSANCSETAAAPAPSNTLSIIRASVGNGCVDSGNNSADFATQAPLPRNAASAQQPCRGGPGGGPVVPPLAARIFEIQGTVAQSPLAGRNVVTSGVVTRINNNGFFIQDLTGDGNPATSDGIFVFVNPTTYPAVVVGNLVSVTGSVVEFNTGAFPTPATPTPTVTELTTITSVSLLGNGYSIAPTPVNLPTAVAGELERYEGMLVTLNGPFTIAQNFFQGRYGQLTLGFNNRLETPTNRHRPGSTQAIALADENARRRIILDDGSSAQNPNPTPYLALSTTLPRAGDRVGSITGVIDFGLATNNNPGLGDYKIHPTVAPTFMIANPRSAVPVPIAADQLKIASFNVLNFFTTFTDGRTADGLSGQGCTLGTSISAGNCRGASNLAEFNRQRTKIVEAMVAIPADAFGLMEIQSNGNVAVQNLVDALNARLGSGTYASTALPTATGTDAIRVAIIYKPSRLSPLGAPASDTDPVNNRPTLAQTFRHGGERFTLVVNHFKSKGSCPAPGDADAAGNTDAGDGQGCWNAQRLLQAQRLRSFVAGVQNTAATDQALLIGDFNAYAQEDPVYNLTSSGYVDQVGRFDPSAYSYVFDGGAGRLDHAFSTGALSAKVTAAFPWHINADEIALADYNLEFKAPLTTCGGLCPPDPYRADAYRSSDHDPIVVAIRPGATAADKLRVAQDLVRRLAPNQVMGPAQQNVLLGLINLASIHQGDPRYRSLALLTLDAAISRTDGCALRGVPDSIAQGASGLDFVTQCAAQGAVLAALEDARAVLRP